ncbi:Biotin synthase [uncultured Desulfobacterium sp.]|uniref:Biotin synthase n=1 Tax=uncultured Desulfobacterium sp. TaxID=201089 RepID=A0A445MU85_9BACT|nr:Biotin synthase [uncultured Desulfobacterium sp.]
MIMTDKAMAIITEKALEEPGYSISYEEACSLAGLQDDTNELLVTASRIRYRFKGNRVFTCSIINAKSGYCSEDCAFCAQSGHHKTGISTYPILDKDTLVGTAIRMREAGATMYSMVTSGFAMKEKEVEAICRAAEEIRRKTDLSVCASLGRLTEPMARRLKESGITSYHHNLETSRSYFSHICTTHQYEEDIETIKIARSAGLRVCSGGIMGLGESWEQRVELAITVRDLDIDSIPINFLNPIAGTPMQDRGLLSPMEALKTIALFRIINPQKDITICGGRERTLKDFQSWIFLAGANGVMIGDYLTTKGRSAEMDIEMIRDMRLEIERRIRAEG